MQIQFNSDSSVMGTENVAERVEAQLRHRLARYENRLTRLEVHVSDENARKGGSDDKTCMIEARPRGGKPIGVTAHAHDVDTAARRAGNILLERLDRVLGKAEKRRHDARPDKAR